MATAFEVELLRPISLRSVTTKIDAFYRDCFGVNVSVSCSVPLDTRLDGTQLLFVCSLDEDTVISVDVAQYGDEVGGGQPFWLGALVDRMRNARSALFAIVFVNSTAQVAGSQFVDDALRVSSTDATLDPSAVDAWLRSLTSESSLTSACEGVERRLGYLCP